MGSCPHQWHQPFHFVESAQSPYDIVAICKLSRHLGHHRYPARHWTNSRHWSRHWYRLTYEAYETPILKQSVIGSERQSMASEQSLRSDTKSALFQCPNGKSINNFMFNVALNARHCQLWFAPRRSSTSITTAHRFLSVGDPNAEAGRCRPATMAWPAFHGGRQPLDRHWSVRTTAPSIRKWICKQLKRLNVSSNQSENCLTIETKKDR